MNSKVSQTQSDWVQVEVKLGWLKECAFAGKVTIQGTRRALEQESAIRIPKRILGVLVDYSELPHLQFRISGKSWPNLVMCPLCSINFSCMFW